MSILSHLWRSKADSPGVYRIRNTVTGCEYIGATTLTMRLRWKQHIARLNFNRHDNKRMQADWNTYGAAAFEFSVIEVVKDKQSVFVREIYWQDRGFSIEGRYNPSNNKAKPIGVQQELPPALQGFAERFEALNDDERLGLLALARKPDGAWRFREDRIAKFIGGRVEDRVAQVRDVRGSAPPPPKPAALLRVRDNGLERLIDKYGR